MPNGCADQPRRPDLKYRLRHLARTPVHCLHTSSPSDGLCERGSLLDDGADVAEGAAHMKYGGKLCTAARGMAGPCPEAVRGPCEVRCPREVRRKALRFGLAGLAPGIPERDEEVGGMAASQQEMAACISQQGFTSTGDRSMWRNWM